MWMGLNMKFSVYTICPRGTHGGPLLVPLFCGIGWGVGDSRHAGPQSMLMI